MLTDGGKKENATVHMLQVNLAGTWLQTNMAD